jgi:hypothetical protein
MGFDFIKFGKPASYHSYLAKGWGLTMAVAVIASFAFHRLNPLIPASLVMGLACNLEGIAMSLVLPAWHRDVKTLRAAWHFRGQALDAAHSYSQTNPVRLDVRQQSIGRIGKALLRSSLGIVAFLSLAIPALAVDAGEVAYVSGTSSVPSGTLGILETTSTTTLVFTTKSSNQSPNKAEIDIPYQGIQSFQYYTEVAHHLGVVPAIAVSLVKRRERRHLFSVSYTDKANTTQVAVFEVSKNAPPGLLAILRARAPQGCRLACAGALR